MEKVLSHCTYDGSVNKRLWNIAQSYMFVSQNSDVECSIQVFCSSMVQSMWYSFCPVCYADPLVFWVSLAALGPELKTCSTTVLKELQVGHWIPKKCQLRRWLFVSQSLHMISTTRCKSAGMGCSAMSLALASHAAAMDCCETTVFLQIGQR